MKAKRPNSVHVRSLYNLLPVSLRYVTSIIMIRSVSSISTEPLQSNHVACWTSRWTFASVSLGISIGIAGTLIFVGIAQDEDKATKRIHVPRERKPSGPTTTLLEHKALRYGMPSNSNVLVRSGYVVSFDYRYWTANRLCIESQRLVDLMRAGALLCLIVRAIRRG